MLDDQEVVRVFLGDQVIGVLSLGVHRVGGDDAPVQGQRRQQRREAGDLVRLAVHGRLSEHGACLLVEGGEQVHRPAVAAGMTGAPHDLPSTATVRRWCCPCTPACSRATSQGPHGSIQRGGVHGFQDAADGGLTRRVELVCQRVTADPESGQDLRRRVRDPFADAVNDLARPALPPLRSLTTTPAMAYATPIPRVRHSRQVCQQARALTRQDVTVTGGQI